MKKNLVFIGFIFYIFLCAESTRANTGQESGTFDHIQRTDMVFKGVSENDRTANPAAWKNAHGYPGRLSEEQLARTMIIDDALNRAEKEMRAASAKKSSPPQEREYEENVQKEWNSGGIERLKPLGRKKTFALSDELARENIPGGATDKHRSEIGAETFYFRYTEPDVMEDTGAMEGLYGLYAYRPGQEDILHSKGVNYYKLEGRYAAGEVDYRAENDARLKNIDDWALELRGILGREYVDTSYDLLILFYSGFGYRYLNDDTSGRTSTVGSATYYGYQRESNYYYVPIGVEFSGRLNDSWSWTLSGEYDWLAYGKQISHLSDGNQFLSTQNDDIKNNQNKGYGMRGSFKAIKKSSHINFLIEPFVRYWRIDDSEIVRAFVDGAYGYYLEPKNRTMEAGVKFGIQF